MNSGLAVAVVLVRTYAAFKGIISDCDEVYNYWEPLNLLTRYFGKKTWEYQPEYSIRSWTYLLPYALLKYPYAFLEVSLRSGALSHLPTYTFFYLVRLFLGLSFAFAECYLGDALSLISPTLSNWFLLFQIFSPGVFQASISLLPSSFALVLGIYATGAVIKYFRYDAFSHRVEDDFVSGLTDDQKEAQGLVDYDEVTTIEDTNDDIVQKSELSTAQLFLCSLYKQSLQRKDRAYSLAVLFTAIGGLTGWPFALVLIVPFVLYALATVTPKATLPNSLAAINSGASLLTYIFVGISCLFIVGYVGTQFDYIFYRKTTIVPLNIVTYNVLSASEETGPQIFGTESISYYPLNLLLNFHVIFLMSLLDLPISAGLKLTFIQSIVLYRAPLLIWYAIFFLQPHKEERFMYPVYHLICISAAMFATKFTRLLGTPEKRVILYRWLQLLLLIVVATLGVLRTVSLVENYGAPLAAFRSLSLQPGSNVCIGREWYHYPSSFFLESHQRLRYTESGFRGMLPGDFQECPNNTFAELKEATSLDQPGFNNKNQYNPDFVIPLEECDYFVDIDMPVDPEMGEVDVLSQWNILRCENIIDPDRSYGLAKLIYLPTKEFQAVWNSPQAESFRNSTVYQKLAELEKPVSDYLQKAYVKLTPYIEKAPSYMEKTSPYIEKASLYIDKVSAQVPGQVYYHKFCVAEKA